VTKEQNALAYRKKGMADRQRGVAHPLLEAAKGERSKRGCEIREEDEPARGHGKKEDPLVHYKWRTEKVILTIRKRRKPGRCKREGWQWCRK